MQISKWGNSLAIRIPADVARALASARVSPSARSRRNSSLRGFTLRAWLVKIP